MASMRNNQDIRFLSSSLHKMNFKELFAMRGKASLTAQQKDCME